jgi:aspartyl-tRNA synthetase, archaeal type
MRRSVNDSSLCDSALHLRVTYLSLSGLSAFNMTSIKNSGNIGDAADSTVTVKGWVQDIRNLGGISFLTLRDRYGTIQITMPKKKLDPELFDSITRLSRESVISVTGEVKSSNQTALGVELIPVAFEVLSSAEVPLPMGVIDKVNVEMDTRLNNRYMDIRKPEVKAIFEIRSAVMTLISEAMVNSGFINVNTPKIGASGAEGGATLFNVDYFGKPAYLAQSPQLYKQILMSTGLDRIFEIGPAFRAEHSNTNRHVTEFISFDGEMSWIEKEEDVMKAIEETIDYVLKGIKERCPDQLRILGKEINVPTLPYPILTYSECLKMVQDGGIPLKEGDDLGTEGEKLIGDVMAEKGFDLYFIAEYPEEAKPFYIMEKDGTSYSFSFDLDYKGQEISSGGQREHRYDVLVNRMKKKGLDPDEFSFYLDAFRYGMPPHGGWGIGVDRLVTKILDLPNVREAILFPRDMSRLSP